mgnify:CR=1 FL=1
MLIVGLGNPGDKYHGTRHNIGFEIVDALIKKYNFPKPTKKFSGLYCEGFIGTEKIRFLKPQTFMNLSGNSVREAKNFYKIADDKTIVIYDELDLATGKIRIKINGGNNGHNGLKSIDENIGKNYKRMRIGIARPDNKNKVNSYVLSKFSKSQREIINALITSAADHFELVIQGEDEKFMSKVSHDMMPFFETKDEINSKEVKPEEVKPEEVK